MNSFVNYFAFGPDIAGYLKSFYFYRGSYQFPQSPDPYCQSSFYSLQTYKSFPDLLAVSTIIPNECLECQFGYSFDVQNQICSNSLVCNSTQHNFQALIGKCDDCGINCKNSTCGNGKIEGLEVCDDGMTGFTSGCSSDCLSIKDTWKCDTSDNGGFLKSTCYSNCALHQCTICELYTGYWSCNSCDAGYIRLINSYNISSCVSGCPIEGYYVQIDAVSGNKSCIACSISNCSNCSLNPNKCLKCLTGKYTDNTSGYCYDNVPASFYVFSDNIISSCGLAMTNCSVCTNGTYCTQCLANNYFVNSSICVSVCPAGYYLKNDTNSLALCDTCKVDQCKDCGTDQYNCSECLSSMYLDISSLTCFNDLPTNFYIVDASKKQIKACVSSLEHCLQCLNDTYCQKCTGSYFLNNYTNYSRRCIANCSEGYYGKIDNTSASINSCELCQRTNCSNCSLNPNICIKCLANKYMDVATTNCYDSPPINNYISDTIQKLVKPCNLSINYCNQCYNSTYCSVV